MSPPSELKATELVLDFFERQVEEDGGIGVLPAGVSGREEGADITGRNSAQQCVGNGVKQNITIAVAGQPFGVINGDAADTQWNARLKRV